MDDGARQAEEKGRGAAFRSNDGAAWLARAQVLPKILNPMWFCASSINHLWFICVSV